MIYCQIELVLVLVYQLYPIVNHSIQQFAVLCDSYQLYETVISSMWQLSALCDSYESYPTVISSMRQLLVLCDSYQSYATVTSSMRQLSVLCDTYQLYATVISPARQLLGLCDRYEVYATVINLFRQLQKKYLLCHYWATVLLIDFVEILDELVWKNQKLLSTCKKLQHVRQDSKYTSESFGQYRRNHQRCSVERGVLGNFATFTGKHLCQSLFFNKVGGLRPAALSKKTLWHTCFPVNFEKFQRTPFLQKSSGRLLLSVIFAISLAQKFSLTL